MAVQLVSCAAAYAEAKSAPAMEAEQWMIQERSPATLFVKSDGALTPHVITLLKLDGLYEQSDDLARATAKTQECWLSVVQGRGNKERADLKDGVRRGDIRQEVEECADSMGLFAERAPALDRYTYGACHGAFLDGVRRNLFQLVAAWKRGIRFDSLVFLTGERYLRKQQGGEDAVEKLCDEKSSILPFKKGWKMPEDAVYDTEYDMVKLVWSQTDIPEDMAQALSAKVVFVNAPKGQNARPSTKDAIRTWLQECHPRPGTILACSYPLLWAYQQLVGETALRDSGMALDTIAPALSDKERAVQRERMVSLVFDTVTKCLYEISQQQAGVVKVKEKNRMASVVYDVCNVDRMYDRGYLYSLPRTVLEGFLSGKAFDNKEAYTEEESQRLRHDINELFQKILSINPVKAKEAVITAGAPGSGKTVLMRQELAKAHESGRNFAYLCPDDVCLQNQTRSFQADLLKGDGSREARLAAYNKWRPGSNAATHLILGNLIREQYAFYFGSTSSGPATGKSFEFFKKQRYQIRLIHVTAPDDVRWASIQERDTRFVQTTEDDVRQKGLLLPQRIHDTFLAYADRIDFYYRSGVSEDAQVAATWTRNADPSETLGTLQIVSRPHYEQIKAIHNAATEVLHRPDLRWEATVEKQSTISA